MAKNLQITEKLASLIKAAVGDDEIDTSSISVFEAVLANTLPLDKAGSIFDKARMSRSMLISMAALLGPDSTVPLHTMHMQHSELPVGRVFHADITEDENGETVLRGLFFIPNEKTDLVADINSSTLDEVSVGVKADKMLCSECGWDYLGEDATFDHLWTRTCANDHTIGEDGVHLNLVGLDTWTELSLVSVGAVRDPKILSRSKAQLSAETIERLAASGMPAEAVVLFATYKETPIMAKGENDGGTKKSAELDVTALFDKHGEVVAELATANATVETLTAQVEALTKERDELTAKAGDTDETVAAELKAAKETLDEVTKFLAEHAKAALVASGEDDPKVPEGATELVAAITAAGVKLHQIVGADGTAQTAAQKADSESLKASKSAFRTRR